MFQSAAAQLISDLNNKKLAADVLMSSTETSGIKAGTPEARGDRSIQIAVDRPPKSECRC